MQTDLLHITIIGCLVLLFGSTYRKRPSHVVRAWLIGWVLILLHFAALVFHPSGTSAANLMSSISLAALFGCGVVFLSAPSRERHSYRNLFLTLGLASLGLVICTVLDAWSSTCSPAYFVGGALVTAAWLMYVAQLREVSRLGRALLVLAVVVTTCWFNRAVWHGQFDSGLMALLTQIYVLVGISYIAAVHRISAGTATVSSGLVAWAAVFPTAALLEHLHLAARVQPEFWNIPKYFVAFGMILTLLEEEIIVANSAAKSLLFQASHDQLTGLRNRATLEQDLQTAIEAARGSSWKCALICFDLDRFKHINDTYGHGVGDTCLRVVGERMSRFASEHRNSARIGGEEFGLVLGQVAGLAEAETIARRVEQALRQPIRTDSYFIDITASIGIALWPDDGADPATVWRNADSAMYRAKKSGGNQIMSMSPEILRLMLASNEMELALRHALREDGLELWFQPIFGLGGELHSVEALIRLRHPELGLVLPSRFVALAEERGLIVPLGDWVLKRVCAQLADWRSRGVPQVPIAMNISALQITSSNFAVSVLDLLSQFEIDPSLVAMEITETAMLRNVAEASRQIDMLTAASVSFSVDDFGIGYSSLDQLDKLDVEYLKIDRSFVDRMYSDSQTRSIIAAIISMAHSLNLRVVAEGIENQRTLDDLSAMGCDLFQGYLLGRPQAAEEMDRLLLARRRTDVSAPHAGRGTQRSEAPAPSAAIPHTPEMALRQDY